jgi:hypothetical protein
MAKCITIQHDAALNDRDPKSPALIRQAGAQRHGIKLGECRYMSRISTVVARPNYGY